MNTVTYRFESEIPPITNLLLKIEINCREHFTVFGYQEIEHSLNNGWFSGNCKINSFVLEELLSTKLRALYQRRKGRDLYYALSHLELDTDKLVDGFKKYMEFSVKQPPSQKKFIQNMDLKMEDPDFGGDIYALLRPGVKYNQQEAYELIKREIIEKL